MVYTFNPGWIQVEDKPKKKKKKRDSRQRKKKDNQHDISQVPKCVTDAMF